MRKIETRVLAASCTLFLACGGANPKAQNTTTLPTATATAPEPPKVDLSPVPMPDSLVVLVHVTRPAASADVISAWAGQPLDAQSALAEMVGERIAKVVDLDSPADLAVIGKDRGGRREPDLSVAVALPVKNFDAAKAALQGDYGLLPIDNGAFEIQRSGSGRHDGDSDFRTCAIAPAVAWSGAGAPMAAGGRVVCSRDATARDALLPYLTRGTAALASIKDDVHVEARPGPFRELAEREHADISRSGSRFMGSAFRPMWQAGIEDLIDSFTDVTNATLDADIDQTHGTARMTINASGSKGLVTRMLSAHPERAEAPPASFFKLPSDADFAFFEHGLDPDQLAPPREALLHNVEAVMVDRDTKLKDADRKAILDSLGRTFDMLALPLVYARGVDFAKAVPAVTGLTEASDVAKIRAGVEQAAGWEVFGVEAPAEKISAMLKGWSAVLARPAVIADMHGDAPSFRVSAAPRNAPAGTIALSLTMKHEHWDYSGPKAKKLAPLTLTMHTLIVPDHGTAWVVNALDEATAVAKARALVSGNGGTLAGRAGLDALKNGRSNAAGFLTPRGLGLGIPLTWVVGSPWYKVTSDPLMGISSASQYTTPILISATEGSSGSQRSLTITADMPRAALADFLAVGPRIFH